MIPIDPNKSLSFKALKNCAFERPRSAGSYWHGFPHYEFVDNLRHTFTERGWGIKERGHLVLGANDGVLVACYTITAPAALEIKLPPGLVLEVAVVTSLNMRERTRCFLGVRDTYTEVGVVGAPVFKFSRLTKHFDLPQAFEVMVSHVVAHAASACEYASTLAKTSLPLAGVDHLLCEAADRKFIPWGLVPRARALFCEAPGSSYALLVAVTRALRCNASPLVRLALLENLRTFLPCHGESR